MGDKQMQKTGRTANRTIAIKQFDLFWHYGIKANCSAMAAAANIHSHMPLIRQ